ncbi:MAG: DUF1540 domain-containing protein [Christensenellaceae bacterium]|nr:DUF1540 domain-containing protein [Christensenellaceae bacterium]
MQTIECRCHVCVHNSAGHCGAPAVQVHPFMGRREQPYCDTFLSIGKGLCLPTLTAMRAAAAASDLPRIRCSASDCAFYRDLTCTAVSICIDEPERDSTLALCRHYAPLP